MAYVAARSSRARRATPDPTADGLPGCPAEPRMLAQQILASGKDPGPAMGPAQSPLSPTPGPRQQGVGRVWAIWLRGREWGNVLQEQGNDVMLV